MSSKQVVWWSAWRHWIRGPGKPRGVVSQSTAQVEQFPFQARATPADGGKGKKRGTEGVDRNTGEKPGKGTLQSKGSAGCAEKIGRIRARLGSREGRVQAISSRSWAAANSFEETRAPAAWSWGREAKLRVPGRLWPATVKETKQSTKKLLPAEAVRSIGWQDVGKIVARMMGEAPGRKKDHVRKEREVGQGTGKGREKESGGGQRLLRTSDVDRQGRESSRKASHPPPRRNGLEISPRSPLPSEPVPVRQGGVRIWPWESKPGGTSRKRRAQWLWRPSDIGSRRPKRLQSQRQKNCCSGLARTPAAGPTLIKPTGGFAPCCSICRRELVAR